MIKMIVKMDEGQIRESDNYTIDQINSALDRIFLSRGMTRVETENGVEYRGHDRASDFAAFGKIMLGLKEQKWFVDNVKAWKFCSNDDTDYEDVFNEEDLLAHYGIKVYV